MTILCFSVIKNYFSKKEILQVLMKLRGQPKQKQCYRARPVRDGGENTARIFA